MQNKGIVKFIAVLLMLVCCFYLSFSFVTRHYESKAAAMGEEAGAEYLDSINNEKVYLGIYSLKQCREMEIGLGLDLKGGMNVILEVSVPDVVDVLADHKQDAGYKKAMELAKKEEETSQNDFISLFVKYWKQNSNGRPLAAIFATQQMKGKVSTQSTDSGWRLHSVLTLPQLLTTHSTWFVTVSISSVSSSLTSRSSKARAAVSWSRCLVSRSLSVFVSSFREVQTLSSGRPTTLRRSPRCWLS